MALGFRYKRRRSLAAAVCSSRSWRSRSSVSFSRREREAARRAAERRLSSSSSLALRSSSSTSHFCKASRARILSSSLHLSCDRCRTRSSALRRATASTESPRGRGAACAERSRGFLELSRLSARCDASSADVRDSRPKPLPQKTGMSSSSFRSLSCASDAATQQLQLARSPGRLLLLPLRQPLRAEPSPAELGPPCRALSGLLLAASVASAARLAACKQECSDSFLRASSPCLLFGAPPLFLLMLLLARAALEQCSRHLSSEQAVQLSFLFCSKFFLSLDTRLASSATQVIQPRHMYKLMPASGAAATWLSLLAVAAAPL